MSAANTNVSFWLNFPNDRPIPHKIPLGLGIPL